MQVFTWEQESCWKVKSTHGLQRWHSTSQLWRAWRNKKHILDETTGQFWIKRSRKVNILLIGLYFKQVLIWNNFSFFSKIVQVCSHLFYIQLGESLSTNDILMMYSTKGIMVFKKPFNPYGSPWVEQFFISYQVRMAECAFKWACWWQRGSSFKLSLDELSIDNYINSRNSSQKFWMLGEHGLNKQAPSENINSALHHVTGVLLSHAGLPFFPQCCHSVL